MTDNICDIADLPALNCFLEKELNKLIKSAKLKELQERIALKKNTTTEKALKAILDKLSDKAHNKALEIKDKKIA